MEYTKENFEELQAKFDSSTKELETIKARINAVPDKVMQQDLADFIEGTLEISATGESIAKAVLAYYKVLQK